MQVEAVTRDGFVSETGRRLGGAVAVARVVLDILDDDVHPGSESGGL
jgi:hypothetical protein